MATQHDTIDAGAGDGVPYVTVSTGLLGLGTAARRT